MRGRNACLRAFSSTLKACFLGTLQERLIPSADGTTVQDQTLALTVTGGFTTPLAGRGARLRQARDDLTAAEQGAAEAAEAVTVAAAALTLAKTQHAAAQAAEELARLGTREHDLQAKVDDLTGRVTKAARDEQELQQVWEKAVARHGSHEQLLANAKLTLEGVNKALKERHRTLAALERQRGQVAASRWQLQRDGTLEDAIHFLDQAPDQARSSGRRPCVDKRRTDAPGLRALRR